jgi:uncharacterized protein with HEPN domain
MPKRTDPELVEDIKDAIERIQRYTKGLSFEAFLADDKTQDAVARNLEIIGEAAKSVSADFRKGRGEIAWQDIAGMRDRLIHHYAGVNWEIVWDVIQTKLPELKAQLSR